jgi:hypothetical protein
MASGPSLNVEDCQAVRASGHPALVTNTTFRIAPWADVVFGMDSKWWKEHGREVAAVCSGQKLSTSIAAQQYGAQTLHNSPWFPRTLNSGEAIIRLAIAGRAAKVILLGFDCQRTGGKAHWHGDHPATCGNAGSIKKWPRHFEHLAKEARRLDCEVLNATRETALTCFRRVDLVAVL